MPLEEKLKAIEKHNPNISIRRQCKLVGINRANFYYTKKPVVSLEDEILMKQIDTINTNCPMYGQRRITAQLHRDGFSANHKRVGRLMEIMGIEAIYPKPNTSKPQAGHSIYPYLLKNLPITRPNQVWGVDISYIRLKKEWLYIVALIDWHSRYILSWELSDTMSVGFCLEALQKALTLAIPEIHNSDQGVQFTAEEGSLSRGV